MSEYVCVRLKTDGLCVGHGGLCESWRLYVGHGGCAWVMVVVCE